MTPKTPNKNSGLTVLELTVTLALISVMVVSIGPFGGVSAFKAQVAKSDFISLARFAQESAMWRGDANRIQLVLDNAAREIRVEAFQSTSCPATGTPVVLRRLDMHPDILYPPLSGADAIVQFNSVGELELSCSDPLDWAYVPEGLPDTVFDWSFGASYAEVCIESVSGFTHENLCYP